MKHKHGNRNGGNEMPTSNDKTVNIIKEILDDGDIELAGAMLQALIRVAVLREELKPVDLEAVAGRYLDQIETFLRWDAKNSRLTNNS